MIKAFNILGMGGMYFDIIKAVYDKPVANIVLNGENLQAFPLRSVIRKGCPLLSFLCDIVLEVLVRKIMQEEGVKSSKSERKKVKCR